MLIDIEITINEKQLNKLKRLSTELSKPIPEVALMCMFERCDELLDMFENNKEETSDRDTTARLKEGVEQTDESNTAS